MDYKTLKDLPNVKGVPILVRLDLNVPVQDGKVADDYRIRKALPTVNFLKSKGAKVVLLSHIEGDVKSLRPVFERLEKDLPISFCDDVLLRGSEYVATMAAGDVLLCENLRMYEGEKNNDQDFAKKLASLGKIYVNEAFSVSHRAHASIVGVPRILPSFLGLQFEEEIKNLSLCFEPKHPFVFILGGAKFDTKMPLVEKFLNIADVLIVAGALANDIFKARGLQIGKSLFSDSKLNLANHISNPKIITPTDVVVLAADGARVIKNLEEIKPEDKICDAGPQSIKLFKTIIAQARTVLWNGPLGEYEHGFKEPTLKIAESIAGTSDAFSVVGGGDTVAAISELGMEQRFSFVSTGGGAMLDFLANETLPGIEALKR